MNNLIKLGAEIVTRFVFVACVSDGVVCDSSFIIAVASLVVDWDNVMSEIAFAFIVLTSKATQFSDRRSIIGGQAM